MRLGLVLKSHRNELRLGVRGMAKILGLSPATISRIERGKPVDIVSFVKLWDWLLSSE